MMYKIIENYYDFTFSEALPVSVI